MSSIIFTADNIVSETYRCRIEGKSDPTKLTRCQTHVNRPATYRDPEIASARPPVSGAQSQDLSHCDMSAFLESMAGSSTGHDDLIMIKTVQRAQMPSLLYYHDFPRLTETAEVARARQSNLCIRSAFAVCQSAPTTRRKIERCSAIEFKST